MGGGGGIGPPRGPRQGNRGSGRSVTWPGSTGGLPMRARSRSGHGYLDPWQGQQPLLRPVGPMRARVRLTSRVGGECKASPRDKRTDEPGRSRGNLRRSRVAARY